MAIRRRDVNRARTHVDSIGCPHHRQLSAAGQYANEHTRVIRAEVQDNCYRGQKPHRQLAQQNRERSEAAGGCTRYHDIERRDLGG